MQRVTPDVTRARDLTTLQGAGSAFVRSASGRIIGGAVLLSIVVRATLGAITGSDVIGIAAVAVLVGPVEWIVHRHLLHAAPSSWLANAIGTRESHVAHHRDPDDLQWLLLRRLNAFASCAAIIVPIGVGTVCATTVFAVDRSVATPVAATVATASLVALLHYEWVHLLVHSRYRCRSQYYARLERHHRWHHYRNENYWLGVTVDIGDRLRRTLPHDRADVPMSATARTLVADGQQSLS